MSDTLVLSSSSGTEWSDRWKGSQSEIVSFRPLSGGNWSGTVPSSVLLSAHGPEQTSRMAALDTWRSTLIWLGHPDSTWLPLGLLHSCLSSHTAANGRKGDTGKEAGETRLLLQKVPLFPKTGTERSSKCLPVVWLLGQVSAAVRFMGESDFHDVGWEECHARYCNAAL